MADQWVSEVGSIESIHGYELIVGVDYDCVTIAGHVFSLSELEGFAQLFVRACWQASAQQAERAALDADNAAAIERAIDTEDERQRRLERADQGNRGVAPEPWYCACGMRLSYGVYCKRCGTETNFAWRPLSEIDRRIEEIRAMGPAREYPRSVDD